MSTNIGPDDLSSAAPETLALILAESDKRITAQVQLMLAADARANGLLAASTALSAAGLAVAADNYGASKDAALFAGACAFAVTTVGAACACLWALWPTGVDVPGWSPRLFKDDVTKGKTHERIQAEVASKNQEKVASNELCNERLSQRARVAMSLLAVSPMAAASCAAFAAPGGIGVGFMFTIFTGLFLFFVVRSWTNKREKGAK